MFGKAVKVLNKAIVIILVLGFTLVGVNFSFPRYLGTVAYADDETPSPTPTETPIPTSSPSPLPIPETSSLLSQRNTTLSSLIDSDGYLTDAGLLSLKVLPDDPQRYIDTKNYSNGKKSLLLYSNAIKYKNKNGKYELIDNSIIDANDSVYKYKNKASDIEVLLSDDLNQNSAINVNYLGYSIGFKPLGILKKVDGKGQAELSLIDTNIEGQNDKTLIANKKYDSIEYSKTFNEDTKINITPASSGIKEDIILSSIPKQAEFSYELKVDNATPVLRRDGNVYFVDLDKGVIVAAIAAPIMNDSSPESGISSDIDVKLEKVDDTTYKYTLIPDKTYLKNAIYPVVIDPTVTRPGDIGDTWVQSNSSQDYSNSTKFIVGRSSAGTKFRGLIIINSTGLTYLRDKFLGCRIDEVKYHAYESYSGSSSPTIEVHPILESWNYGYVYWGIQPDFDTVAYSSATVQAVGPYEWNVTAPAKDWIYNTADYCHSRYQPSDPYYNSPTYGILLKITNESLNQYKEFSSDQNSSNKDYFEFFFTDTIAPNQPQVVEKTSWTFQPGVDTGSITVRCSKCTDLPTDYAVGTKEYWFERSLDGGTTWGDRHTVAYNGADYQSYIFTGIPDNTSVKFRVCAVDNNYPSPNPNTSPWTVSSLYNSPDCTAPVVPQNQVYASPDASINYKNVTNPTIYWSGVTDEGNHFEKVEYVVDNTNGTWQTLGTTTSGSHQITISGDGIHTIYIRGKDTSNNYTSSVNYATITYKLDSTAPMATLSVPSGNLQGIVEVTATITNNGAGSNPAVCNWTLDYGNGNPATSFITPALASGTTAKNNEVIFEWDTTALTNNQYYTLRLIASDDIGNSNALNPATVIRLKSSDSIGVDPGLQIDQPSGYNPDGYQPDTSTADQYTITSPSTNVEYEKKGNDNQGAGINGLSNGQLYANNKQVDSNATTNDGHLVNNFNAAAYDNGWLYPEGSIVFLYAQAKDTTQGDIFSTSTQQSLEISDTFDNTNKIDPDPQSKSNIEQVNGVMRLTNDAGVYNSPGKFESAVKTFAGEVSYIDLIVNQTTPGNSSISYQVLVDGTWSSITPISTDGGTTSNPANRKYYTTSSGDSVKLKATLTKSSGNETPTIMSWSIYVRFTTYVNAVLVDNSFPQNARGITNLTNTTHNETNESIELKYDANLQKYAESGSVESTMRYTSNDVIQACLEVNETKPANTNITYSISTNGTNGTFIPITPGDASKLSNWMSLSTPGKQVVIKAELSSTDSSVTPKAGQ